MAFEPGGHAGKLGNRYEGRWVVRQLLRLLAEEIRSVIVEPVGADEPGVDLWIEYLNGVREAQQCKAENGSKPDWKITELARRRVLERARRQLSRHPEFLFGFVSSIPAGELRDLSRSARHSTGDAELFYQDQVERGSQQKKHAFRSYCQALDLDVDSSTERALAFDQLQRTHVHQFCDDFQGKQDLRTLAKVLVNESAHAMMHRSYIIMPSRPLAAQLSLSFCEWLRLVGTTSQKLARARLSHAGFSTISSGVQQNNAVLARQRIARQQPMSPHISFAMWSIRTNVVISCYDPLTTVRRKYDARRRSCFREVS